MKRSGLLWMVAWFALIATPGFAKTKAKSREVYFRYDGKGRSAAILIPEQTGPLPVLLLLHGSGRTGEVMIAEWKDLAAKEGIVLVAPDAADTGSWNLKPDSPDFLHLAVDQAAALHPIDRSRIYMFGHSAGAEYVLILSLLDSEYFAAAALHAGMLLPAFNNAFDQAYRRMPIAIWSGAMDQNFPPDVVRATKRLFDANGYDVQLTIMPGHDHNYYAVSPQVNREAWDFLKAVRLPQNTGPAQPSAPEPKSSIDWFQRASDQMNLRMPGSPPFHMKVTFHAFPGEEVLGPKETPQIMTGDGTYEEEWLAPHKWRREVTFPGYHAIEVESEKGRKMQASPDYEPSRVLMLLTALTYPIPRADVSPTAQRQRADKWSIGQVSNAQLSLVRISSGSISYYFLPKGLLVLENNHGLVTGWKKDVLFADKVVPTHLAVKAPGLTPHAAYRTLLTADVTIEAPGQIDPAIFDLPAGPADPGMTLRPLQGIASRPEPLDSPPFWPGPHDAAMVLQGVIDRDGRDRELEVILAPEMMDWRDDSQNFFDAFRKVRWRSAEIDGSRCESSMFTLVHRIEHYDVN